MTRNRYSNVFENDIKLKASTCTLDDLLLIAKYKYKYDIRKDMLQKYLSKRKIRYVGYNPAKARIPINTLPIGSERTKSDGMVQVKIANDKWEYKQRYLYEKYHNVKLTSRDYIIFLDGNRNNFNKNNLERVDCRESSIVANMKLACKDKDISKSAIQYAKSVIQIKNLEGKKLTCHKKRIYNKTV